jgi:hypothetical protein
MRSFFMGVVWSRKSGCPHPPTPSPTGDGEKSLSPVGEAYRERADLGGKRYILIEFILIILCLRMLIGYLNRELRSIKGGI